MRNRNKLCATGMNLVFNSLHLYNIIVYFYIPPAINLSQGIFKTFFPSYLTWLMTAE